MAILHVWSDVASGKLSENGRVAIAYLAAVVSVLCAAVIQTTDPHHPISSLAWSELAKAAGLGGLVGLIIVAILDLTDLLESGTLAQHLLAFARRRGRAALIGAFICWAAGGLVLTAADSGGWFTADALLCAVAGVFIGAAGAIFSTGLGGVIGWLARIVFTLKSHRV